MIGEVAQGRQERVVRGHLRLAPSQWFLGAAFALFLAHALYRLGTDFWSTEEGSHGPIVLASGLWLLWRQWAEFKAVRSAPGVFRSGIAVLSAGLVYLLGTVTAVLGLQMAGAYLVCLALLYSLNGGKVMARLWFPLLYLAFLIPLPDTLVALVTGPLRIAISDAVAWMSRALGLPVVNAGVVLQVGAYELLVAQACSGLNAIISLSAIGLFYIYLLHRADWSYALLLMLVVLPAAIAANLLRVLLLVLVTYYFGDAAAQGLVHDLSGIITFLAAMLLIIAADRALQPVRLRLARRHV